MATNGNISHLDCHEKKRYFQKISSLGCDPYSIPDTFFQPLSAATELPILAFNDIYIYLIHNPSPYTGESLKAYKSTEAYRYFVAGWVLDSKIWHLHNKKMFLVKGKVNHSQAVNMTPTQPWIVVHDDGTILMAHCTCKAGLGEACSHAAALMYAVLAAVNLKDGLSSTEMPCAWVLPSKTGKVQYEEICNISFMKKKTVTYSPLPSIPVPTEEEFMDFYQKLYECDVQEESSKGTAILSVIEGHSHRYKPKTLQLNLPEPLSKLYSKAKLHNDLSSLLVESESIFDNLQITEQQPNVLAYAVHCQTDTHGRPVAGVVIICRDRSHLQPPGYCTVGAGCSPRGKVSHSDRSGQMRIYTPSLISTLQKHLASTDPELGGPLENLDVAPGRVSSHWESRVLQGSIMAPVLGDSPTVRIDPVTLAALQDTGWYTVDLNQAQSLVWGDGEGATFGSLSTCRNKSSSFFCTGSGFGCHYLHLHKGECQTDQHLEGCRVYKPLKNGSECWIEKNGIDEDWSGEIFGVHSRCFFSSLTRQ